MHRQRFNLVAHTHFTARSGSPPITVAREPARRSPASRPYSEWRLITWRETQPGAAASNRTGLLRAQFAGVTMRGVERRPRENVEADEAVRFMRLVLQSRTNREYCGTKSRPLARICQVRAAGADHIHPIMRIQNFKKGGKIACERKQSDGLRL